MEQERIELAVTRRDSVDRQAACTGWTVGRAFEGNERQDRQAGSAWERN